MTRRQLQLALFSGLLLAPALVAWGPRAGAQEAPDPDPAEDPDMEVGESPERYAQVKVVDGHVLLRKGDQEETLTRGVPVGEGDVVESHGRGVLQLGDGSVVAFGPDTRFRVAALFADQDESRRVLLVLERGRLRVSKGSQSDAVIRVDTPSGTGTLGNRGTGTSRPDATFTVTPEERGSRVVCLVHGGQATYGKGPSRTQVFAGQRLTVYGPEDGLDRISDFNAFALDEFDAWAGPFMAPRPSASASKVPQEIRYYAGDLDENGKWVHLDDEDSWVWAPTTVNEDWQPYSTGYWGAYGGGMTWVSDEPWGYVTHHHGRWGWRMGLGWYWMPGVYYSPAWVAWNCEGSWFGWSPLGHRNHPCRPRGNPCWNVLEIRDLHRRRLRDHYQRNPSILRAFDRNEGGRRPWFQGRVVVNAAELRDPARFHAVVDHREIRRERVNHYARTSENATGRTILRPGTASREPESRQGGFTRWERPGPLAPSQRPLFHPQPSPPRQGREPERRDLGGAVYGGPQPPSPAIPAPSALRAPRDEPQRLSPRPFPNEGRLERRDPVRTEAPRVDRPDPIRREPARQDPPRMERQESRPPSRQEPQRSEAPRQEQRAPARTEAPRQEQRAPARSEAPRQDSRPESRPSRMAEPK